MFSKILIANRGEIAVRIIRACKEMGIATVAVFSEVDKDTLHVALADESYCIGPGPASESYLNAPRIISAAKISGAQAIHPGYGFLSENAEFAAMCKENGLVFIGPDTDCMKRVSDKTLMKNEIAKTHLKTIPGTGVLDSLEQAIKEAESIGYPVMLKARSGGGGRGIRLIHDRNSLIDEYPLAVAEAEASFDDGAVYLEKYIWPARHIEVQVLSDEQGNVVCLGERDCSIQRRHQKLLEETPSPAVKPEQRTELMNNVSEAVKRLNYTGVGTLEFLLDSNGNFWFMEMNVRLQVEHCITEMLTMVDLVKWQIRTAAGVSLPFKQADIPVFGAAIECRINATAPGTLNMLHVPGGLFVRFDSYLVQGVAVSPFYDSLLGKLVVYSKTREEAVRKMKAALCELVIDGIPTNIEQQLLIISDERFMTGEYDTSFIE